MTDKRLFLVTITYFTLAITGFFGLAFEIASFKPCSSMVEICSTRVEWGLIVFASCICAAMILLICNAPSTGAGSEDKT